MLPAYIDNPQSWLEDFHYFETIKVRFSETDMFGHLNNTVPFVYFEQVRTGFMMEYKLMAQEVSPGVEGIPVVASLHCDYVAQAFFSDELSVGVKIARIGKSSLEMHYVGLKGKEIIFTGTSTMVQMNKLTGKSLPFTEEQLSTLTVSTK